MANLSSIDRSTNRPGSETDRRATPDEPRLVAATRRAFIHRSAVAATALAMLPAALTACGTNDAEALGVTTASTAAEAAPSTTAAQAASTTAAQAASTTAETAATTTAETATTATDAPTSTDGGSGVATMTGTLEVTFTYEASASGGGRGGARNPYIAVWVEDADGNLVDTISVWYRSGKGDRWLNELRRWYSASDRGADVTMSGATRVAGTYTVAWDGTDLDGNPVPAGDYTLVIESAREHGPYSLTSAPLTVGDGPVAITLPDDGEIMAASAQLV